MFEISSLNRDLFSVNNYRWFSDISLILYKRIPMGNFSFVEVFCGYVANCKCVYQQLLEIRGTSRHAHPIAHRFENPIFSPIGQQINTTISVCKNVKNMQNSSNKILAQFHTHVPRPQLHHKRIRTQFLPL